MGVKPRGGSSPLLRISVKGLTTSGRKSFFRAPPKTAQEMGAGQSEAVAKIAESVPLLVRDSPTILYLALLLRSTKVFVVVDVQALSH